MTASRSRPAQSVASKARSRTNRGQSPASREAAATSATSEAEDPGLILHQDPERARVESLTKEHNRLLREIAKKRAQQTAAESLAQELMSTLVHRTTPMRARLKQLLEDISRLFAKVLGPDSHLSRRDKAKVRNVYDDLVGILDLPSLDEPDSEHDAASKPPHHAGGKHGRREQARHEHPGGGYSAEKPAEHHASLRTLFRRLASAFHPDKVQDEQSKAERTSLMKDVTKAYEAGDLARLMELERALLAQLPVADDPAALRRRAEELLRANTELRRQLRSLTAALKELNLELPFDVNLKAADAKTRAMAEVDGLVRDLEQEERRVTILRDFTRAFATGEMTVADFLAGPAFPEESEAAHREAAIFGDDLLLDLIDELLRGTQPRRTQRSANGSSRRRHK